MSGYTLDVVVGELFDNLRVDLILQWFSLQGCFKDLVR